MMRKIVVASGLVALVAAPFIANAAVMPVAMLVQGPSSDTGPAPIKVRKHSNFLPIALGALLVGGGATAVATGTSSGNSPG